MSCKRQSNFHPKFYVCLLFDFILDIATLSNSESIPLNSAKGLKSKIFVIISYG